MEEKFQKEENFNRANWNVEIRKLLSDDVITYSEVSNIVENHPDLARFELIMCHDVIHITLYIYETKYGIAVKNVSETLVCKTILCSICNYLSIDIENNNDDDTILEEEYPVMR